MHLLYLTGVGCLFMCYAVDAKITDCQPRNLTATADDIMRLYIDGVEMTNRTASNYWWIPDTFELPCNATVIGIQGTDLIETGGIQASTDDGYILTNSSWKCTNIYFADWQTPEFDDSDWSPAFEAMQHGNLRFAPVPGIRSDAIWIWTTGYNSEDQLVYCRKSLDTNECILGFADSECDPSKGKCKKAFGSYNCICYEGYVNVGSKRCKDIDECAFDYPINKCGSATGNCVNLPGSYNCSCHQGYRNIGPQTCEASTCNDSTSLIILGVLFGASVLVNIAVVSALLIRHSRNKTMKDEGKGDVGTYQYDVVQEGHENVVRSSPAAVKAYDSLNLEAIRSNEIDDYEELQIEC